MLDQLQYVVPFSCPAKVSGHKNLHLRYDHCSYGTAVIIKLCDVLRFLYRSLEIARVKKFTNDYF